MTRVTILYIFITSSISAINPPQQGTIPDSVLQLFRYQEIGDEYGNPGWIKKLQRIKKNKQNRNEQLYFNIPVLLGKYSDQAQTYFTASEFNQLLYDNAELAADGTILKILDVWIGDSGNEIKATRLQGALKIKDSV